MLIASAATGQSELIAKMAGLDAGTMPGFVENVGQWDMPDDFATMHGPTTVRVGHSGIRLQRTWIDANGRHQIETVRVQWNEEFGKATIQGVDRLGGMRHFLKGDRSRWRRNVSAYAALRLSAGTRSIDVRPTPTGVRICVDDGPAGVSQLGFQLIGVDGLHPSTEHVIQGDTPTGEFIIRTGDASNASLDFLAVRGDQVTWRVEQEAPASGDIPSIEIGWASLLGGSKGDDPIGVVETPAGLVVIAGLTFSPDLPVTSGALDPTYDIQDAFIAAFTEGGGQLQFATYFGGTAQDGPEGFGVGADGSLYLCGRTASADFPVTDSSSYLAGAAFLTRFHPAGSSLLYSTMLNGSTTESATAMTVGDGGIATVTGYTFSPDFPTSLPSLGTGVPSFLFSDAFVARVDTNGPGLLWSVLLGGTGVDQANAIALDASGDVLISSRTNSTDLPITSTAHQPQPDRYFIAKIGGEGTRLDYASYFGWQEGGVNDVAFTPTGKLLCAGGMSGQQGTLPTTPGVLQPDYHPSGDGILVEIDPLGGTIDWATYFGAPGIVGILDLGVDASGVITVAGLTYTSAFPVTPGALQPHGIASFDIDAWVARLDPYGTRLLYSTFVGGSGDEELDVSLFVDERGGVLLTGDTDSVDFPITPGVFDPTHNGSNDGFVMRLTMLPTGVGRFGTSTPGCRGPLPIGVTAMPQAGRRFGFTCSAAPLHASGGFLLLSLDGLPVPIAVEGFDLWIDPATLSIVPGIAADAQGWVVFERSLPDSPSLVGFTAAAQFVFPDMCAPGGYSASNALSVTIQP